jgi:hypothetical protein
MYMLYMDYEDDMFGVGEVPSLPTGMYMPTDLTKKSEKKECEQHFAGTHQWRFCKGLNIDYHYCVFCGTKKDISESEK